MKKITLLFFLIGTSFWGKAQVLNQNAGWPNSAWTLTGSYLATGIQSDPTLTANFAFNDDATASGHEDNIAAESPVINLTPAFNAGEKWLTVSTQYVYRYLANDELVFQYWNADTSSWVNWGTNFDALGNYTTDTNYCSGTPSTYTSAVLNIAGFTPTQLSGFKYRISYDDDPAGADWNYGFCFQSPTIASSTPPLCPSPTSLAAVVTNNSALLSWTENGSATLYNVEYGANGFTQGTGTLLSGVSNSYNLTALTSSTAYSYYVQSNCGGSAGTSTWVGPFNFTTLFSPPANDNCSGAVALTVNPNYACGSVTSGSTQGATQSLAATPCFGNPDDDVWFSFVATATSHKIVLSNIVAVGGTGTSVDAYMQVLSGSCGSQTSILCSDPNTATPTGLTIGQTYYVRVYTYGTTNNITFTICVGTPPPPPANDECTGAIALTVNPDYACGTVTAGTVASATASATDATACFGTEDDDVWYSFVATQTTHRISLTNVAGSVTDMFHSLWTGDCAALTLVAGSCSDADVSNPTGLVVGQTYYVRVNTYTATSGQDTTFNICIGTTPPPAPTPANDECSGAIALTPGGSFTTYPIIGTSAGATDTDGLTPSCQTSFTNNVWYSVVVPASGNITIETQTTGSGYTDSVVTAFTGTCGSLNAVGCDDDGGPAGANNFMSILSLTGQTPGSTLYVSVWRYNSGAGVDGTFNISAYDSSLLSNSSFDSANFTFYPNPVKNVLNLSYNQEISNVEVFNLIGQKVRSNTINANDAQIDMSNLSNGAYIVKVTSNNQVKTIKVMKQ
ncbi:T9SS type A sorting domain-containing protein [Flavobacterium sp. N1994]|uniref:T9SS type A sorting domain-containing protein n=1 Tax=Flavobacterium sp. N1994 TaxID=2986827 RepID=UPI002221D7DC|nr:T9SS type A sorting domain-containing protein [Flavobacterium sp. N1994]